MGMMFRFEIKAGSQRIVIFGAAGILVLLAVLSLPSLLAQSLDSVRAEREVRQYLKQQLGASHLTELRAANLTVPDHAMANRWFAQHKHIDDLAFVSVDVGRLPYLPFSSGRVFVVKTVIRDVDNSEQTHYYSLSARSRLYDFFWVAEQSRFLWFVAF